MGTRRKSLALVAMLAAAALAFPMLARQMQGFGVGVNTELRQES